MCDDVLSELPVPNLGELSDLRTLSHTVRKERSPNALCYSFADLCDLDTVTVALVPEKKGLILKHVEYEVSSQVDVVCTCVCGLIACGGQVHCVYLRVFCVCYRCCLMYKIFFCPMLYEP